MDKIIPLKDFKEGDEVESEITLKGDVKFKKKRNVKRGKRGRGAGARFELRVRKDLEEKGWIIDKWSNNVDLEMQKVVPAKRKFNPYKRIMTIGTGFPDFMGFRLVGDQKYNVVGFEVKINGFLSKEEKEKAVFLLKQKVFNEFFIVKKGEKRGQIDYADFKEKYKKQ